MRLFIVMFLLGVIMPPVCSQDIERLEDTLGKVEDNLRHGVLDFWAKYSPDKARGGFNLQLDLKGKVTDDTKKYLLTQTRMVWIFSRAHNHGITDKGYLKLATHGFKFLCDKMWDKEYGGFYWLVDGEGNPVKDHKSVYTQTFAIYALSEYYLASKDPRALAYAEKLFDLFVTNASDGEFGFTENLDRTWKPKKPKDQQGKTLDTHMHLMECFTTLYQASGKPQHKKALEDMIALIVDKCIDTKGGFAYEPYDRQFNPVSRRKDKQMTTSYGHNVELGWLMLEAFKVLKTDREPYKKNILGLIDHAIEFGCDDERGGIAMYGPHSGHVVDAKDMSDLRLRKSWWEQSEMLVACLEAYAWTNDKKYLDAFYKTWDWTWKHQIDHSNGEWFSLISWDGSKVQSTHKGGGWKSAYHNGRALMMLESRLKDMVGNNVP